MELLISILRHPEGLKALVSRPGPAGTAFALPARASAPFDPDRLYQVIELPLESVSATLYPRRHALLESWALLGHAAPGEATLAHLLHVVLETVAPPGTTQAGPLPWPVEPEIERPRATAAHPRAYRGTKFRPPREKRAPIVDLRPYLRDRNAVAALLQRLGRHFPDAVERLLLPGLGPGRLALPREWPERLTAFLAHANASATPGLPATGALLHGRADLDDLALKPGFVTHLLPLLVHAARADIAALYQCVRRLELDSDPALLSALCRLLLEAPDTALAWTTQLEPLQPERRAPFLTLLILSGIHRRPLDDRLAAALDRIEAQTPEALYHHRLSVFFAGLARGLDAGYLLHGIEIAEAYEPGYTDWALEPCPDYDPRAVEAVLAHVGEAMRAEHYATRALRLWEACARLEGLPALLRRIRWQAHLPSLALALLGLLVGVVHHDVEGAALAAKWRVIREDVLHLEAVLEEVPASHRWKLLTVFTDFYRYWDTPEALARHLPPAYALLRRLSRPPFVNTAEAAYVLSYLIDSLPPALQARALEAGDSSFHHLEAAAAEGDLRLSGGFVALIRAAPSLAVEGFVHSPGKLCRVARLLGTLPAPARLELVGALSAHPLFDPGVIDLPPDQLLSCLRSLPPGLSLPIPHALKVRLEAGTPLSERQLDRLQRVLREKIGLSRLEVVEARVIEALRAGLPLDPREERIRHALQMLSQSDGNRRGLRRLLRALGEGRADYLLQHPATRAWLGKHPRIDAERWTMGIEQVASVEGLGSVRIALEPDPLEALKLGSYVGSCLRTGGLCAYSAAAIVLDINKQVLYARNAEGRVIGRQLVALSEDERLVCFSVYPPSAPQALQAAFLDYDLNYAEILGVELHPAGMEPDIALILAREWWDDGVWEVFAGYDAV